jgi:hypothetical protein
LNPPNGSLRHTLMPGRRLRVRDRRCAGALAGAVLAILGTGARPPECSASPPAPGVATGAGDAQSLLAVTSAITRTSGTTAAVTYRLVGARVFGAAPVPVVGSGAFDLRRGVGEAALRQPSGRQVVVLTPTVVFTHVPPGAGGALPKGKSWLSADLTGSESLNTNFPQFDVQVEGFNPLLYLDETAWGATGAVPLAPSAVGGARVRGYLVTVDLTKALSHVSGPSASSMALAIRSELSALASSGSGQNGEVVRVRMWIDGGGMVTMVRASPPGAGVGTTTITMPRFGVVVRAAPPPLADVVDIAALTPLGERENNGGGDSDGA